MRRWVLVSAALLALAACSRPGEDAAKPPADFTPGDTTPPKRAPGLWEQRVSTGDFVQVTRICVDAATDARLSVWGQQATQDMCEKNLVTRTTAGAWRFSSVCDMGSGGKVTSSGLVTGDFASHYVVQAESSTVGAEAPQMNGTRKLSIDAARVGPCPADMKPGDMALPGGQKINLLDMKR